MTPDPHPTLRTAIRALTQAADGTDANPPSAEDLADRLRSLSNLTGSPATLIGALGDVLDRLAESLADVPDLDDEQRTLVATWLERAGEHLAPVGEALDRARLATGKWA